MAIMKEQSESRMARKLITSVSISLVFVLPFMILEWINRRSFHEGFPVALFGLMWLLTFSFILISMPIIRNLRAGNRNATNLFSLLTKVVLLTLIAGIWIRLLIDQLPCFLGVPNCD
jgi:cation transport ATPase